MKNLQKENDHLRRQRDILKKALGILSERSRGEGILFHSDRGCQYAGTSFRQMLERKGFISSMSRKGNCYDNAALESFWSTLKPGLCQALKAFGWHRLSLQGLRIHVEIKQSGGTVFGGLPGWPHALNHASPGTSKIAPSPIGWKHWLAETPYLLSLVPFGLPYRQIWDHSGSTLKQAEPGPLDRSSSSSLGLNNKGKFRS